MAKNKSDESKIAPPEPAPSSTSVDPAIIENQNNQILELKRLTSGLVEKIAELQAQQTRDGAFLEAVHDVKAASSAVTSAILRAPATIAAERASVVQAEKECDCGPCDCVSERCCCYDIVMTWVRVLAMQPLEVEDSNVLNPWAELEIKMFAYLDGGIGAVIPSMFSTISLSKLLNFPGIKVRIERCIGTVCLPQGKSKTVNIFVDCIEEDSGLLERVTGGRDEQGSASSAMVLDCCCNGTQSTTFDIAFTSGGQGGGAIQVEFVAVRKC